MKSGLRAEGEQACWIARPCSLLNPSKQACEALHGGVEPAESGDTGLERGNFMKKILVSIICGVLLGVLPAAAHQEGFINRFQNQQEKQEIISRIGFRLLNANKIQHRMVFQYNDKNTINAVTYYSGRRIVFYQGLMAYTTDEDQVAAVLAHEISHGIDYYHGILRGTFSFLPGMFTPRKYEKKADKRAIDFMVNAGYNPVAMIVMMSKTFPQDRYEFLATHPLASRRMAYVYEYIYFKYPEFLKNNKYQDNIYYQNFLLTSQENRRKLQRKVETRSKSNVNYD